MIPVIFILFIIIFLLIIFITIKRKKREWTLAATWIIAITAITAVFINMHYSREQLENMEKSMKLSKDFFKKQIIEMKRATELNWRPYLYVFSDSISGNINEGPGTFETIEETILDSGKKLLIQRAENSLIIRFGWRIKYENKGKTPLYITWSLDTAFVEDTWKNLEDENHFENWINSDSILAQWQADYIILPDEERVSPNVRTSTITIPFSELKSSFGSDSTMYIYLLSYYKYRDLFDYEYSMLLIKNVKIVYENGQIIGPIQESLERFRWDLGIG